MPPALRDPDDPAEWLRRARSNLARARADRGIPDVLFEDLCFDAQQAAEKALKGLLVHRRLAFPRTHVVTELLTLLTQGGVDVPDEVRQAGILTQYAVQARYPWAAEDVAPAEYVRAVDLAEGVVRWVEGYLLPPRAAQATNPDSS